MAMTDEKVVQAAHDTIAMMRDFGGRDASIKDAIEKLEGMAISIVDYLGEGRREKAMRHLGFMQGVAWALGCATVEDLMRINMPAGETFKRGA